MKSSVGASGIELVDGGVGEIVGRRNQEQAESGRSGADVASSKVENSVRVESSSVEALDGSGQGSEADDGSVLGSSDGDFPD